MITRLVCLMAYNLPVLFNECNSATWVRTHLQLCCRPIFSPLHHRDSSTWFQVFLCNTNNFQKRSIWPLDRLVLVSLFNGISGLFNTKANLQEEQYWSYLRFLCLMAYQLLWVIQCQSHTCRRTVVVLSKVSLFNGISTFAGYSMPKPYL